MAKKNKKRKQIEIRIDEDSLINFIQTFSDEDMADFAMRFGENGDVTYEIYLLKNLYRIFKVSYPIDVDGEDEDMSKITEHLKEIDKIISDKIIKQ